MFGRKDVSPLLIGTRTIVFLHWSRLTDIARCVFMWRTKCIWSQDMCPGMFARSIVHACRSQVSARKKCRFVRCPGLSESCYANLLHQLPMRFLGVFPVNCLDTFVGGAGSYALVSARNNCSTFAALPVAFQVIIEGPNGPSSNWVLSYELI